MSLLTETAWRYGGALFIDEWYDVTGMAKLYDGPRKYLHELRSMECGLFS